VGVKPPRSSIERGHPGGLHVPRTTRVVRKSIFPQTGAPQATAIAFFVELDLSVATEIQGGVLVQKKKEVRAML